MTSKLTYQEEGRHKSAEGRCNLECVWALPKVAKLLSDSTIPENTLLDDVTAASERRRVCPSFLFLIVRVS